MDETEPSQPYQVFPRRNGINLSPDSFSAAISCLYQLASHRRCDEERKRLAKNKGKPDKPKISLLEIKLAKLVNPSDPVKISIEKWMAEKEIHWARQRRLHPAGFLRVRSRPIRNLQSRTIQRIFPHLTPSIANEVCMALYGQNPYRRKLG